MLGKAATLLLLAGGLSTGAAAQAPPLAVDPIVGHWETATDGGEATVVADARKWKAEPAATPFPVAAVSGVKDFSNGVLRVQFKLIGGESDQIAGLAFGITPKNEYYYARYNTKDGNVALWQFVNGDRKRILEGPDHVQLPLGTWHELKVEVRGARVAASVNDQLRLEHTLPAPVAGRVGFWKLHAAAVNELRNRHDYVYRTVACSGLKKRGSRLSTRSSPSRVSVTRSGSVVTNPSAVSSPSCSR